MPPRIFYLLAFAYLLVAVLFTSCRVWCPTPAPRARPGNPLACGGGPLLIAVMPLMPLTSTVRRKAVGPVDFVYTCSSFLLIASAGAGQSGLHGHPRGWVMSRPCSVRSVMGGMLLLLGWASNPRPGFGGVGIFFSRYLLTVGLPSEWLHRLTEIAEEVRDPVLS